MDWVLVTVTEVVMEPEGVEDVVGVGERDAVTEGDAALSVRVWLGDVHV